MQTMTRREMIAFGGLAAITGVAPLRAALAQGRDTVTIAFPADVPTWDPNARTSPVGHAVYKCVFDQPLEQAPDLARQPGVITRWSWSSPTTLDLEFRPDVVFHDGTPFTSADFRWTFHERPKGPVRLDTTGLWRRLQEIDTPSPTRATMRFTEPFPSAVSWLHFLASFIVPKAYMERVGLEAFIRQPIGSGPYKLVEYQQGSRIVLEAHDRYWGGTPAFRRVVFEIARDFSARSAAIEARRVDAAVELPVREATRLGQVAGLSSRIEGFTDIFLLQISNTGPFQDERVRLAAHHAIDKAALSRALFNGLAKPIAVPAAHGTPGYPDGFDFAHNPQRAGELLRAAGFSPQNPARIKFFTTNGSFVGDFDISRAIDQMWRRVGIQAELETIEVTRYQEALRANALPEATIYRWGNSTGDPEMYTGYLLNPSLPFAAWRSADMGERIGRLFVETDEAKRFEGYRDLNRYAIEKGYSIPLLQGVVAVAHQAGVPYRHYANGWILPATWRA